MSKNEFLSLKHLERFQHYKNRNPTWVKLYYSLLDDPEFIALGEQDRLHYIMCILIASRCDNRIPNDPSYLARMMRLPGEIDVTPLIDAGFLIASRKHRAIKPLAVREQHPCSEKETEKETERETEKHIARMSASPRTQEELAQFEEWWKTMPARDGMKHYKPKARELYFKYIKPEERAVFLESSKRYRRHCDQNQAMAVDPHRFILNQKGELWRDFIPSSPAAAPVILKPVEPARRDPPPPEAQAIIDRILGRSAG
jgi:hypothetical protein